MIEEHHSTIYYLISKIFILKWRKLQEFLLISNWLTENNQIRLKYNYYLKHIQINMKEFPYSLTQHKWIGFFSGGGGVLHSIPLKDPRILTNLYYQVKNFRLKLDKREISSDDTNNENQLYDFANVHYILSQM